MRLSLALSIHSLVTGQPSTVEPGLAALCNEREGDLTTDCGVGLFQKRGNSTVITVPAFLPKSKCNASDFPTHTIVYDLKGKPLSTTAWSDCEPAHEKNPDLVTMNYRVSTIDMNRLNISLPKEREPLSCSTYRELKYGANYSPIVTVHCHPIEQKFIRASLFNRNYFGYIIQVIESHPNGSTAALPSQFTGGTPITGQPNNGNSATIITMNNGSPMGWLSVGMKTHGPNVIFHAMRGENDPLQVGRGLPNPPPIDIPPPLPLLITSEPTPEPTPELTASNRSDLVISLVGKRSANNTGQTPTPATTKPDTTEGPTAASTPKENTKFHETTEGIGVIAIAGIGLVAGIGLLGGLVRVGTRLRSHSVRPTQRMPNNAGIEMTEM